MCIFPCEKDYFCVLTYKLFVVYINFILKVQSKVQFIMYTDAAVFNDGRFGRGANSGFLRFYWCPPESSHVEYCDRGIQLCSSPCPENNHQFGLRCYYGNLINNNKIYIYVHLLI